MQKGSGIQWNHSHNFSLDNKHSEKKVRTVFWLTTIVMVLEIAAGTWSGSMALLADGWHMGTHSAAFAITIFAYWYARKHAKNKEFSFGTGKVTFLGGFASAIALAIVALMMAIESIQRLLEPQKILFDEAVMVAVIGLIVNIVSVFWLRDDHHDHGKHLGHSHKHGHKQENEQDHKQNHQQDHNLRAAYFHILADTLTSVFAIIALLTGKLFGWIWMDAIMGIVGAVIVLWWSYGLIIETSGVLLDKSVNPLSLAAIEDAIKTENETVICDIHIWHIAPTHRAAILSVESKQPLEPEHYKKILRRLIPELSHISIEINRVQS